MQISAPLRRRNSIVITSLVDVMFVLLFFFLLASSYLDWRSLSLNLGGVGAKTSEAGELWSVQVLSAGQVALNGETLPLAEIRARLQGGTRKVVLQPGAGVSLQQLVDVLDALKPSGAALILGKLPS